MFTLSETAPEQTRFDGSLWGALQTGLFPPPVWLALFHGDSALCVQLLLRWHRLREMPGPGRGDSTKFKVSLRELSPVYRTWGRRSPQNWGVVLTFVKTLCECRLEHTVVQYRQWLRCLSRPCWSWKSYHNPCRCTKKKQPPPQHIIHPWVVWFRVPSLIPHLKTTSEANALLGWFSQGNLRSVLPKPSDFSRKQTAQRIESQSSDNYINEHPPTS